MMSGRDGRCPGGNAEVRDGARGSHCVVVDRKALNDKRKLLMQCIGLVY